METKACSKCGIEKEISFFYKKLKGYQARCKECVKCIPVKLYQKSDILFKKCSSCNKEKNIIHFIGNKTSPDGFSYWCKLCANSYNKLRKYNGEIPKKYCFDCNVEITLTSKRCSSCKRKHRNKKAAERLKEIVNFDPGFFKKRYAIYGTIQNKRKSEKYHSSIDEKLKKQRYNLNNRISGYTKDWYEKNKEKELARCKKWRLNNPEKLKEITKKTYIKNIVKRKYYDKKRMAELPDNYVAIRIRNNQFQGLKLNDIPKGIIETKRLIIKLQRELKK